MKLGGNKQSSLILGLGNINSRGTKWARPSSSDDDSDVECGDDDDEEVKTVTCENVPAVFLFTYHNSDASEEHNRIEITVALPAEYEDLNYSLLYGGMAVKIEYKWPSNLMSEATIFPDLTDRNLPELVGLRQAIKSVSSGDMIGSVIIRLPFQADSSSIVTRVVAKKSILSMTLCRQAAEGSKLKIASV